MHFEDYVKAGHDPTQFQLRCNIAYPCELEPPTGGVWVGNGGGMNLYQFVLRDEAEVKAKLAELRRQAVIIEKCEPAWDHPLDATATPTITGVPVEIDPCYGMGW